MTRVNPPCLVDDGPLSSACAELDEFAKQGGSTRRAEFDTLIALLNERGEIVNDLHRELQTKFTRIAQLQRELDDLKRSIARSSR